MPVVRRRDHHGINVLPREQLAIVVVNRRGLVGNLLPALAIHFPNIRHTRDPRSRNGSQRLHNRPTPPAESEEADVDGFIRVVAAGGGGEAGGHCGGRGLEKSSTVHRGTFWWARETTEARSSRRRTEKGILRSQTLR